MAFPTTPFGPTSTAAEVIAGVDLSGTRAIVTGASSGIGIETARALAASGADVTIAVRDPSAGATAADSIARTTGRRVQVHRLDLADLDSVAAFTADWRGPLHILVNNAGIMMTPEQRTANGWELQFATNHLGHFALALGLHDALATDGRGRIVSLSSSGHGSSRIRFDDLFFTRHSYDAGIAYGQSKTANALFAVGAGIRWRADGITANAVMPGGIFTQLQRHWDPAMLAAVKDQARRSGALVKSPEQGAATSVLAAASPLLEGVTGRYLEDCGEAAVVPAIIDGVHGVRSYALDPGEAELLWEVSMELLAAHARR